jgi:hypothetical protein
MGVIHTKTIPSKASKFDEPEEDFAKNYNNTKLYPPFLASSRWTQQSREEGGRKREGTDPSDPTS